MFQKICNGESKKLITCFNIRFLYNFLVELVNSYR